jgi:trans-AT polyketide synthase, acyltransferase and oxidoreductase domains
MSALRTALLALDRAWRIVRQPDGSIELRDGANGEEIGVLPALPPERLGSAKFRNEHGVRLAYAAGSMAGGIASVGFVRAMGSAGVLASFGAAGVPFERIEHALGELTHALPHGPWAANLIHTPDDPQRENALAELYVRAGLRAVEASAFMEVSPSLVFLRAASARANLHPLRLIVKLSNPELARAFLAPPPASLLDDLVAAGRITREQAQIAARFPLADDLTVEADSAGHTDNRALVALLPAVLALRGAVQPAGAQTRIGAAGGIGTPAAAAAAFALGADYIVTGSINQACIESGTSDAVKTMLAAPSVDVMMAPAADMFELGVQVQVLKTGTLFPMRARRLRQLYETFDSLEAIPEADRARIERDLFRMPLGGAWEETRSYLRARDPASLERAESDPKARMAMTFRWYLGQSWRWASNGTLERSSDYQIWCGPAMAAFNAWTVGTRLGVPEGRSAPDVAVALMRGAAYLTRVHWLRLASGLDGEHLLDVAPGELRALPEAVARAPRIEPAVEEVRAWLIAEIAAHLAVPEDEIDTAAPFVNFALDSAAAVLIMARLEKFLGRPLSPTLVWNYPTIDSLAAHLEGAA